VDILEDSRVAEMWEKEPPRKASPSDPKWLHHIEYLAEKNVVSRARLDKPIIHWASYFAVGKPGTFKCKTCHTACASSQCHLCQKNSAECLTRAIFDARMWNDACRQGAHCNLVRPDVATSLLCEHAWGEPNVGFFSNSWDVKNFFYQVPISEELSRHLGISCNGIIARCVKLPMGWHRSVITACAITAAIILSEVPNTLPHQPLDDGPSPPAFITVLDTRGEIRGWVFHYVDNIFIIVDDKSLFEGWCAHIRKQLRRFNVALKYDRTDNIFLGLEYTVRDGRLFYHHSNVKKWQDADISMSSSRRDVSHAAGIILWDRAVADIPWMRVAPTLEALSRVGKEATSRKLWDALHTLPPHLVASINQSLDTIRQDVWHCRTPRKRTRRFTCSDASMEKVAFVIMEDSTSKCISSFAHVTDISHIYLLELKAARMCIEFCSSQFPNSEIWIAIDNKAVYHAMRRRFSLEPRAAAEFLLIEAALEAGNISLIPVLIRGVDNLADCKTRGKRLSERRFRRTWETLVAATEGRRPRESSEEISDGEGESDEDGPPEGENHPADSDD